MIHLVTVVLEQELQTVKVVTLIIMIMKEHVQYVIHLVMVVLEKELQTVIVVTLIILIMKEHV